MNDAKEEMVGMMEEAEEAINSAIASVEASSDAEVIDSREVMAAYIAKQRELLTQLESVLNDR